MEWIHALLGKVDRDGRAVCVGGSEQWELLFPEVEVDGNSKLGGGNRRDSF